MSARPPGGPDAAEPEQPLYAAPGSARVSWRWIALVFGPAFAVVAVRWWLGTLAEQRPPLYPMEPVSSYSGWFDMLAPWLGGALACVAGVFALRAAGRRLGWARIGVAVLIGWWLLCAAGAASALRSHFNRAALVPQPPVTARVIAVAERAASTRSSGGTLIFVTAPALGPPQRVLIDTLPADAVAPGADIVLQWARGRHSGQFVTGWAKP